ncbi:hypothetical protein NYT34_09405 [Staphylococcus aureus]|nr:hypothetical protein [Staphylococcus aureus]
MIKERIDRERKKSDERIKDAKENNDSNEVGYLLKDGKVTKVYGDQNSVSFVLEEKATELLFDSKPNSIVMLHKYPRPLGFSLNDLFTFFKHPSIKSMTIVTNKGQVKFITKSDRFQGKIVSKFCAKYFTHINMINDSHIEKLLKKLYSINMIKYKVR